MTVEPQASPLGARNWHEEFDATDPHFGDLYDEISDDLVNRCPVAHTVADEHVISRYSDVVKVMQD